MEFLSTYKHEFNTYIISNGTIDDIIQRLYYFYKPYIVIILQSGPREVFELNPATIDSETKTFLENLQPKD